MTTSPPELKPDPLHGVVAALRQDMQREFAAINRRLDWVIGIQIGTFVVLVGLLVSILLKG